MRNYDAIQIIISQLSEVRSAYLPISFYYKILRIGGPYPFCTECYDRSNYYYIFERAFKYVAYLNIMFYSFLY